jgi:ATP-dependent Clp protease ATP-binding subunit ClpA
MINVRAKEQVAQITDVTVTNGVCATVVREWQQLRVSRVSSRQHGRLLLLKRELGRIIHLREFHPTRTTEG